MAAHLPCLPGSLHISVLVLTSFVPPDHNQGVSLAPCQGLALWKIFLPTTGSFFVFITFADRLPVTALFPADVPLPRSAFSSASQQFFQSSVFFPAWLRSADRTLCIWLLTSTTSVFPRTTELLMQPGHSLRVSWYLPASFLHHNLHLLLVWHRRLEGVVL